MSQKGLAPIILILLAAIGLILYILISNTFSFKDRLFSLLYPKPTPRAEEVTPSVPDEILIKFKPGVPDQAKERILNTHALQKINSIPQIEVELTKVAQEAKDQVIEALRKNPLVEYAESNFLGELLYEPNDPAWGTPTTQWGLKKIGGAASWDVTHGSTTAIAAVIDTGMMINHEDLTGKAVKQYNTYDGTEDVTDTHGHGTAVSGVVGEWTDNGKGGASLGWLTPIMPIDFTTPEGDLSGYAAAQGLIYAADNGATSVNMSWGFSYGGTTLKNAVDYAYNKGLILVAAIGNSNASFAMYPAAYDNVIAVGATQSDDTRWVENSTNGSNYGPKLDVMAPGKTIYTTNISGSYNSWTGTSMAAPFVATLATLIRAVNPVLTNVQVTEVITSTALDLGDPGWDQYYGWGRIQADKALEKASGITPLPPDTQAPQTSITSPTDGSTVSGVIDITADASDDRGVTKVEFYIDGTLHATDTTSPYLSSWDTTLLSNGTHTLQTKAYDLVGNVGSSSLVTVTVDNTIPIPTPNPVLPDTTPPTVSITYPSDGATVQRNTQVTIQADATDNVKVSKVEFLINNSVKCTDTSSPYTCTWKVPGKRGVTYTITAKAYDASSNTNTATITVKSQ